MSDISPTLREVQERLGPKVLEVLQFRGDDIVILAPLELRESFRILKEDAALHFNFLSDMTVVDYWRKKEPRFELVYQLLSLPDGRRLRVRVPVAENDAVVQSLTPLWAGANFMEREAWDLFGIKFIDHPDLRRILLFDEFKGHPLRKDYPINQQQHRVTERKVEGTFVDERSHNKLLRLRKTLGSKDL
jgi:NADH-quinone oxidoreductase subunit C